MIDCNGRYESMQGNMMFNIETERGKREKQKESGEKRRKRNRAGKEWERETQ